MSKPCQHIILAVNIAISMGNKIYSVEEPTIENKKIVVDLCDPITITIKKSIDSECKNLRYWEWEGVPHNPSEVGYTCDKCNVVLIFPGSKTPKLFK